MDEGKPLPATLIATARPVRVVSEGAAVASDSASAAVPASEAHRQGLALVDFSAQREP